jgi:hypothetical protein
MGKSHKTVLMGLLAVVMVCLMLSTATTTVTAADGWGTLKAGDEMQWQSVIKGDVKINILSVEGKTITIEFTREGRTSTLTINADESSTSSLMQTIGPYLISLENKDDFSFSTSTYDFENTTYQAYYDKTEYTSGAFSEWWYDTNTGILFELRRTEADGTVVARNKLISTTADLAESTGGGAAEDVSARS